MKQKIHPTYHEAVTVTCSCGETFEVGSTAKTLTVEVCSACHPFYTGTQKLVDTGGRVDRFRKRLAEAQKAAKDTPKKAKQKRKKDDDTAISL